MDRIKYDKPSRVNFVTILLILALLAGAYFLIQFGPPYYRRWKASSVISEEVNKIYPKRFSTGQAETELYETLRKETEQKLRDLGIVSEFAIQFKKDASEISGSVEYTEKVNHWFVNKTTTLRFYVDYSMSAAAAFQ